jgi:hypothetical protein
MDNPVKLSLALYYCSMHAYTHMAILNVWIHRSRREIKIPVDYR